MQIVLNEDEMKTAIRDYITSQGIDTVGKDIEIDLTAGRGANGFSASINIVPVTTTGNKMEDNFKPVSKDPVMEETNNIIDKAAKEPVPPKAPEKSAPKPAPKETPIPAPADEKAETTEIDFSADSGPVEPEAPKDTVEGVDDVTLLFG